MSIISDELTGAGPSEEAIARRGSILVTGTFVATIELQRKINGNWESVQSFTGPTTISDATSFDNEVALPMRFLVVSFTSGTINVELVGTQRDGGN